jgi:hypothetical protein
VSDLHSNLHSNYVAKPRLGARVLDLMDDMANWGQHKYVLGEVDVFKVQPDYELYGHMNINYLKLATLPRFDDGWQPVLDALSNGRFFVSTGEVLIPDFKVGGKESGRSFTFPAPRLSRWRPAWNGHSFPLFPRCFGAMGAGSTASALTLAMAKHFPARFSAFPWK